MNENIDIGIMKLINKKWQKKLKGTFKFLVYPLYYFYRAITASLRYKEIGREELDKLHADGEYLIFSLWHDELFPLMKMQRQFDILTIVSPSVDGSLLADLLNKLGLRTVRGSSTRKGLSALLNAVKLMRAEHVHACVTIDGPLGPRHVVKEGVLFLAHHAKAHIVPIRISMKNHITFNTWDKFQVPLPFSRVVIEYSKPYRIESETLNSEVLQIEKEKLQKYLDESGNAE